MSPQRHVAAAGVDIVASPNSNVRTARFGPGAIVAAFGFLLFYLSVSFAQSALSDRDLPLPGSSAAEVAAYVAANPAAVTAVAVLQGISVACFAVLVRAVTPLLGGAGATAASRVRSVGLFSVAAMLASCLCTVVGTVIVSTVSADVIALLRQASFYAGGVANVSTLGGFVFAAAMLLGRTGRLGRPTRWFGYVAGAMAMLSVLSLGIYYANAFLPIGRLLCMAWTVVAAVVLARRAKATRH